MYPHLYWIGNGIGCVFSMLANVRKNCMDGFCVCALSQTVRRRIGNHKLYFIQIAEKSLIFNKAGTQQHMLNE